ncbi:hypothetical protein D3C71_926210 [compost metagenome]
MVLGREQAGAAVAHAGARCDEKGPVRANEHSAYRLDDTAILLHACDEAGEIVVESGVDHGIGLGGASCETVGMLQIAVMHIRARLLEPACARIRTGEAEHLMASPDEFSNDPGADEAGCTG